MARMRCPKAAVCFCIVSFSASAHPSAVTGGRATCGAEFDKHTSPYVIPDIREAWFVRRLQTCSSPFSWYSWNTIQDKQPVYIAAISPEIARFQDRLQLNAVLLGPGHPTVDTSKLPKSLVLPAGIGGTVLTSPAKFSSCAFVDENAVMTRFSSVVDGRCMEQLFLPVKYDDKRRAGLTWDSWWIYSKNHTMNAAGKYQFVTWLSERGDSSALITGKYELTLGPWTWSGYASASTKAAAQAQVVSCSCAFNSVSFAEQHLTRIGNPPAGVFSEVLPYKKCAASTTDVCHASEKLTKITANSPVEWSGMFSLKKGRYRWTYYATRNVDASGGDVYEYPDAAIDIVITGCTGLEAASEDADVLMKVKTGGDKVVNQLKTKDIFELDDANHTGRKNTLTLPANVSSIYLDIEVAEDATSANGTCIFTQHLPGEFGAGYMSCIPDSTGAAPTCSYVFPIKTRVYNGAPKKGATSACAVPMNCLMTAFTLLLATGCLLWSRP